MVYRLLLLKPQLQLALLLVQPVFELLHVLAAFLFQRLDGREEPLQVLGTPDVRGRSE